VTQIEWCECGAFVLWYVENLRVCTCGHPEGQHIDRTGLCMGDVKRSRGPQQATTSRTS
jgi:hypothetical protein